MRLAPGYPGKDNGCRTDLSGCQNNGGQLGAVSPLGQEGESEGLYKDGGEQGSEALEPPAQGRGGREALLRIRAGALGKLLQCVVHVGICRYHR